MSASQKYELIHEVMTNYSIKNLLSYLCECCRVSRSGYYRYFSASAKTARQQRLAREEERLNMIQKAIEFQGRLKKGIRQVTMVLHHEFNVPYNHKSVHRIMRKYGLLSPIRRANPYRRMAKATKEHQVHPNRVKRKFQSKIPGRILLTDITYLKYGKNQTAYLSTILDSSTKEIVAYKLSSNLKIDFILETLDELASNPNVNLSKRSIIHSDQGSHYTSPKFSEKVKSLNLKQSMSRRGNCWDNAPQESFFGHLKDETNLKEQETYEELQKEIDDYMYYYNHHRYQWNLKKMTPVKYRNHLQSA